MDLSIQNVKAGRNLADGMFRLGIAGKDAFIIVLSENSEASTWVQEELSTFTIHRLAATVGQIITVILDGITPPPGLAATSWVTVDRNSNLAQVASQIAARLGITEAARQPNLRDRALHGLPNLGPGEEQLFATLCGQLINSQPYHSIISAQEIMLAATGLGFDEQRTWHSVSVLEQYFYLTDVEYSFEVRHPAHARITFLGLDRYLRSYRSVEYKRELAAVLTAVVNGEQYNRMQIAISLGISEAIVAHVFEFLERNGYATVAKHSGGATLKPKPTIRNARERLLAVAGLDQLYVQGTDDGFSVYQLDSSDPILQAPTQEEALRLATQLYPSSVVHFERQLHLDRPEDDGVVGADDIRQVRPASPERLEVDLRSTSPIILLQSAALPQLSVWLRATNLSDYDVRITHISLQAWFGQPTTKLTLDRPVKVAANSILGDIGLTEILDQTKVNYIQQFLRQENPSKTLYLYLALACEAASGPFSKDVTLERREPELSTIIR